MSAAEPALWLLVVAAVHLGFQLTVDLVVYPALGEVPSDGWHAAHDRHSRRILPIVAVIYPALVLVLAWTVLSDPEAAGTWMALAGGLVSVATTATVAAPVHSRLSSAPADERLALVRRLDRADRLRTVGAVVCLVGAVVLAS